jgi:hypothetical protein
MPKRALAVADSDEDEPNDELPLRNAKGSFEAKPHDDPEKVQELGRYLETIGGSAALVQSWTCMVRTKTTSGEQWTIYADENNRRLRSRNEVAAHFGLHVQKAKKAAARSASTSTALTPSVSALTEADAEKMTVVWATLKGYPPWPAEVVGASGRHYTVRFFATDNEATLPESALTRYNKKQRTLRAGQGRSVGSATLRAQFFEAVSLADEALGEDSGDLNWRTDGCPWIGQRVRRFFSGGVPSDATVGRWLPAGDTADDFALWHVPRAHTVHTAHRTPTAWRALFSLAALHCCPAGTWCMTTATRRTSRSTSCCRLPQLPPPMSQQRPLRTARTARQHWHERCANRAASRSSMPPRRLRRTACWCLLLWRRGGRSSKVWMLCARRWSR